MMELSELTDKAIDYMLPLLDGAKGLTKWEIDFVESITEQWEMRRTLTDKQKAVLAKIWDKIP